MTARQLGTLYGVGVGPGDPELVTLRALRLLKRVPVICVPKRGISADSYALGIVDHLLDRDRQEVLDLLFPMTRDRAKLEAAWKEAAKKVSERLLRGLDCAFITEGDPTVYSTFMHLMRTVRQCLPHARFEVVPGVSSVTAVAARVGWSLAEGDERIAILPATYEDELLREILERFDTVVLMKVNSAWNRVTAILEEMGLMDRAVYVARASSAQEEVMWDVRSLAGRKLDYLSIVLVCKRRETNGG